jgi:soluble lytic murein transglycosylase
LALLALLQWRYEHLKETRYDPQIVLLANLYGVNPALIKAVVWRESRFNPTARGRVGEIGLMQIRPLTAEEWAHAEHRGRFQGDLFAPQLNLQVGTWYLGKLLKRYERTDNPAAYALADYNAGRANGAAETNSAAFMGQITFPATQDYVRSILYRAVRYQSAFGRQSS